MEFTANTPISRSFPNGYETLYRVSYNYRSFALLLDTLAIESVGNKSVEIVLPWCIHRSEGEEVDIHVLRLIDFAITMLHELHERINHLQSKTQKVVTQNFIHSNYNTVSIFKIEMIFSRDNLY